MKSAAATDPILLAELAATLRAIAATRKQSRRLLRDMASAYELRAANLMRGPAAH